MIDDPDKLSSKATKAIQKAQVDKAVYVSSISVRELNMLVSKGRLSLKQSP